jgi:hypothetical protein
MVKWLRALALAVGIVTASAGDAPAQDPANAARDIQTGDDFRVRVSAALTLGRTHAPGSRPLLEHALDDANPAVRTAAAAGLAALGDPAAVPALQTRAESERVVAARSQMTVAIAMLSRGASPLTGEALWQSTRYVVAVGDMHNRAEVGGAHASDVLRTATRTHAETIPGVLVTSMNDASVLEQASARHLPVFLLEGSLQHLRQTQKNAELSYNAQVDYSMRRVPQQQLRGMLTGSATSFGSVSALQNPVIVTELEDQAIEGAAQSALRGAARGFGEAVR